MAELGERFWRITLWLCGFDCLPHSSCARGGTRKHCRPSWGRQQSWTLGGWSGVGWQHWAVNGGTGSRKTWNSGKCVHFALLKDQWGAEARERCGGTYSSYSAPEALPLTTRFAPFPSRPALPAHHGARALVRRRSAPTAKQRMRGGGGSGTCASTEGAMLRGTRPGAGGACAAAEGGNSAARACAERGGGAAGPGAESRFVVVVPSPSGSPSPQPPLLRRHVQPSGAAAAQQQQQPAGWGDANRTGPQQWVRPRPACGNGARAGSGRRRRWGPEPLPPLRAAIGGARGRASRRGPIGGVWRGCEERALRRAGRGAAWGELSRGSGKGNDWVPRGALGLRAWAEVNGVKLGPGRAEGSGEGLCCGWTEFIQRLALTAKMGIQHGRGRSVTVGMSLFSGWVDTADVSYFPLYPASVSAARCILLFPG